MAVAKPIEPVIVNLITIKDYTDIERSITDTELVKYIKGDISNIDPDIKSVTDFINDRYTNLVVLTTTMSAENYLFFLSDLDSQVGIIIAFRNMIIDTIEALNFESQTLIVCDIPLKLFRNNIHPALADRLIDTLIPIFESVGFNSLKGKLNIGEDKYIFLMRNSLGGDALITK